MKVYLLIFVALVLFLPQYVHSQSRGDAAVWLSLGNSSFDLAGTGDAFLVIVRGDYSFNRILIGEVGFGYMDTKQSVFLFDGTTVPYFIHELQVQAQLPFKIFRPYVGVGIGGMLNLQGSDDWIQYESWEIAYTVAAGTRIFVTPMLGLRAEARYRGMDSFAGHSFELTGGLGWQF